MKEVKVVQTLPTSTLNYWKYFMEDADFKLRYHTRRGDQDIRIGTWTDAPNDMKQRANTFQSPISSSGLVQTIVGTLSTSVREIQLAKWAEHNIIIKTCQFISGSVGEQFNLTCEWSITSSDPLANEISVKVSAKLEYKGNLFQSVVENHVAELTHAAFVLWLAMCRDKLQDIRAASSASALAPIPTTGPLRSIETSGKIPSSAVASSLRPSSASNETPLRQRQISNAGDLFDVSFESDNETGLDDLSGGRKLSRATLEDSFDPSRTPSTQRFNRNNNTKSDFPLPLPPPTSSDSTKPPPHPKNSNNSRKGGGGFPGSGGEDDAPAPAAGIKKFPSASSSASSSSTNPLKTPPFAGLAPAAAAMPPIVLTPAHSVPPSPMLSTPAGPPLFLSSSAASAGTGNSASMFYPPIQPTVLSSLRAANNAISSSSSSQQQQQHQQPKPNDDDAEDDENSSMVSTEPDDSSLEFFDAPNGTGAAMMGSGDRTAMMNLLNNLNGELNLVRSQMSATLNRIATLEHELAQERRRKSPSSEHELLTNQRLDELSAAYKRAEQNRRDRDRVTQNRLIELETQLTQRWKRYGVVAGVAAVVFLLAWPVIAVRVWERARSSAPRAAAGLFAAPILSWITSWFSGLPPKGPPK